MGTLRVSQNHNDLFLHIIKFHKQLINHSFLRFKYIIFIVYWKSYYFQCL